MSRSEPEGDALPTDQGLQLCQSNVCPALAFLSRGTWSANRSQQAHAGVLSVCLGTNCLTSLVLSSEGSSQFILLVLPAPSASFSTAKEGTQSRRSNKGMDLSHFLNHIPKPSGEWLLGPPCPESPHNVVTAQFRFALSLLSDHVQDREVS